MSCMKNRACYWHVMVLVTKAVGQIFTGLPYESLQNPVCRTQS